MSGGVVLDVEVVAHFRLCTCYGTPLMLIGADCERHVR